MKRNVLMGGKNSGAVMIEGLGLYVPMSQARSLQAEVQRLCTANLDSVAVCEQALQAKTAAEQERDQLKTEISHLQIEVTNLRGLKPEIPPMPGEDWPRELPRYGLRWNGHNQPTSVPYKDGYWTPWYLANRLYEELERERKAVKTACANWGEMKQERDQLKAHCENLSMAASMAVGALPNESCIADVCVAAIRHFNGTGGQSVEQSIAQHDAQVIKQFVRDYTDWQGIDWMLTDFMHKRVDELSQQAKEVQS